jgi:hypothetical protein
MTRKKRRPAKSLMLSINNRQHPRWHLSLLAMAIAATVGGCAGRPWSTALEGERFDQTRQTIAALTAEKRRCGESLDGDLAMFYSDPLGKKALSGYLQFSQPGSYKFVVANPLGQTVLAIAGDRLSYQAVNVFERQYLEGSMRSFGLRHGLPQEFLGGTWGEWLTGASERNADTISAIREDKDGRGLWVSYRHRPPEPRGTTHMLWQTESKTLLTAILEDDKQTLIAEVNYSHRMSEEACHQPLSIHITGLDFGIDIRLQLSNIKFAAEKKQYSLPIPRGYLQQYLP